jgi:hypothetical protein
MIPFPEIFRSRKPRLTTGGISCADYATPSIHKSWHYFANKRRSLGRHSSLADQSQGGVFFSEILTSTDRRHSIFCVRDWMGPQSPTELSDARKSNCVSWPKRKTFWLIFWRFLVLVSAGTLNTWLRILVVFSVPPGKCWNSVINKATNPPFHIS